MEIPIFGFFIGLFIGIAKTISGILGVKMIWGIIITWILGCCLLDFAEGDPPSKKDEKKAAREKEWIARRRENGCSAHYE